MNTMNGGSAEKMTVDQKLELLRTKMKERGMDAYMVPTADFHESEYVGDHFKCRQFLTGFTGSAGIAVVTMKEACLWVDGRYFVQAAVQLQGTSVKMMKMGQEGVPSVAGYLEAEVLEKQKDRDLFISAIWIRSCWGMAGMRICPRWML